MQLTCPWCGPRDVEEFTFGGNASALRPAHDETAAALWLSYLYNRENPRGAHREFWHHEAGCRRWLVVMRDTSNHSVHVIKFARDRTR